MENNPFDSFLTDIKKPEITKDNKRQQTDNENKRNKRQQKTTKGDFCRKTFYLDNDMVKAFKKIKKERGLNESFFIRTLLEEVFEKEFGEEWRKWANEN